MDIVPVHRSNAQTVARVAPGSLQHKLQLQLGQAAAQHLEKSFEWLGSGHPGSLLMSIICLARVMECKRARDFSKFVTAIRNFSTDQLLDTLAADKLQCELDEDGEHTKFLNDSCINIKALAKDSITSGVETKAKRVKAAALEHNSTAVVVLTFEEKRRLATTLQSLPVVKQSKALEIIIAHSSKMGHELGDEHEVDLDEMDHATLLKLFEFCCGPLPPRSNSLCRAIAPHASACKPKPDHDGNSDSESSSSDSDDDQESDEGGASGDGDLGREFPGSSFVMPLLPCFAHLT
jgi:hypothetical protein